jgi:hypothetical protein
MEIRSGTGGDEACLFAADMMRMYTRYAERHGFRVEVISASDTELGGVKEAVFSLTGQGAFSHMKYESGVHQVKRIPITESNGRIQTSTCTVAVLPEVEDVDVVINPGDVNVAPGGPNITGPDSSENTGNPDDGFNTPNDNNHYEVITPGGSGEQAALSLTLSLSSTPANGIHFVVGETVVFTAVWANTTPYTLKDQIVSIGGTVAPVLGSELLYLSTLSPEPDVEIAPGASGSSCAVKG